MKYMMAHNRITAVLFDWDFTLAYTLSEHNTFSERLAYLFQQHGVQASTNNIISELDRIQTDIQSGSINAAIYPQKKREIIRRYRILLERLHHPDTSYEFAYTLYSGYANLPLTLYPDVLPTLAKLGTAGYRLGILSNHSISVRAVIEKQVGHYIPANRITISEEVGVHKPGKTVFQKAAAKMQVPTSTCAYVGDNLQVDAVGAVAQGNFAQGIWLDRHGHGNNTQMPARTQRITSLHDLLPLL
jgi:FMN phosphatase YigB (HAD superfamily)